MEIIRENFKITVGSLEKYALNNYLNISLDNTRSHPSKELYRYGVCVEHIPSKQKVYCNSERCQIGNKKLAMESLTRQIKQQNYKVK